MMRTWTIFWNSEQYVYLSLYGGDTFWMIQQFSVCAHPPVLSIVHYLGFCCCLFRAGLPRRRCQGGEQRGGGDSHEPPRKNHLRAHCQPSRQLFAYGTVTHPDSISQWDSNSFRCSVSFSNDDFYFYLFLQVSLGEFELKAPVTIRLKAGTGPVIVSGLHLISTVSFILSIFSNSINMRSWSLFDLKIMFVYLFCLSFKFSNPEDVLFASVLV